MKHLKIKYKLLLGFMVICLLMAAVGIVGMRGLRTLNTQYKVMLTTSNKGITAMAAVRELFQMQRMVIRNIIIDFNDPVKVQANIDTLQAYDTQILEAMDTYESTISDKVEEKNFYMAKEAYNTTFATSKREFINAAQRGDYERMMQLFNGDSTGVGSITQGLQDTVLFMNGLLQSEIDRANQEAIQLTFIQVLIIIVALVLAVILGVYLSLAISHPIKMMSEFFLRFAETGDLALTDDDRVNISRNANIRDEIGCCINAAAKMVGRLNNVNDTLIKVAERDLTVTLLPLSDKDSLGLSVSKVVESLNDMFSMLRSASGQVSAGALQIAHGAQRLAAGCSQQTADIELFYETLTEMQEKTSRNADSSLVAAKLSGKMGAMLQGSVASMGQMLEAMKGIDESAKNITRIIKVIDEIAFQTNILALNAAVEAARAGQHGKGFAVVAEEVRNLAAKSAAAAKETSVLIEGSSIKVKEGNQIVRETNNSLEAAVENSKEVVRLSDEVSEGSAEQASAIKGMHQRMEQISSIVQENSASSQESAAASQEMSSQASKLDDIIAAYNLKDEKKYYYD